MAKSSKPSKAPAPADKRPIIDDGGKRKKINEAGEGSSLGILAMVVASSLGWLVFLFLLPYEQANVTYGMARNTTETDADRPLTTADYSRVNIRFDSDGSSCDAWLYTPTGGSEPYPVVIMAHGLGSQKDLGLHQFASVFASSGLAVMVFDYRTFGGSDGEPRHWVSPRRHVEDWHAALDHVKAGKLGPKYDANNVALWGTSFAGGHVLVVAADAAERVKAVVSMVPFLSGPDNAKANLKKRGVLSVLRMMALGLHDQLRRSAYELGLNERLGMEPEGAYIKLLGAPGEMAFMQLSEEEIKAYYAKHPLWRQGGWQPRVLARLALEGPRYSPIKWAKNVTAPVMFLAAKQDSLCPYELVEKAAALVPEGRGQVLLYDVHHFALYLDPHFADSSAKMAAFLRQELGLPPLQPAPTATA